MYTDEDGMVVLKGRLTPEIGAVLKRALDAAQDKLFEESDVSAEKRTEHFDEPYENRRSDALGLVAESALENGLDPGTRGDRYQVVVHVHKEVLEDPNKKGQSVLEDGPWISAETSRRIACDASRVEIKYNKDGTPMDVGRKTRVVPAPPGGLSKQGTKPASSQAVTPGLRSAIPITRSIGPMAEKRTCPIFFYCVIVIIDAFTNADTEWRACRTENCSSADPTEEPYRRFPLHILSATIPLRTYSLKMKRMDSKSIRERSFRSGAGNLYISTR